jgi:hypothetical protein
MVAADAAGSAAEAPPAEVYRDRVRNSTGLREFVPPKFGIPLRAAATVKINKR